MKVTANGKTFTFPDGTSTEDIGSAIDEYFAGQSVQQQTVSQDSNEPAREEPSLMQQAGDWLTGGQSAGQIAEQAGRGLVNIPFDVLQGGASLINAISQGLGGPKVLDDVYRPVERPTDPYAQAGETIGGYLVPGVGTAGSMAIGSLAEAANQKGDFAQNAAKNAGVNLAAQGVLSAAAKGIGRGITAKGKDAMRAAYVSKIAEKAGDSPAKFITEVNKLKSQSGGEIYNTIFSGKHMKELDALHEVLQQTARSDTANVVTQTGQSQANRIRTIGATATLGVSMGLEAGFGAMMRLYESKAARNALLRLANTKAGTPAYERALNNAANAIRPILANDATDR
ncbi:TPA: hypothetical protein KBN66_002640 [Escherichia coli]|nr:hypothetical protein [Escherichia coli]